MSARSLNKFKKFMVFAIFVAMFNLSSYAANGSRPLLLLYETVKGEGADAQLAQSTTRAIRNYLRETQKVDVAVFNRESPAVKRAIMERKLTEEKIAGYASQSERLEVAKELGFSYAAGAEVAIKELEVEAKVPGLIVARPVRNSADGEKIQGEESSTDKDKSSSGQSAEKVITTVVEVKIWVGRTSGGKPEKWEAIGSASAAGAGDLDLDNAMQSAASFAVNDIARRAFVGLQRVVEQPPTNGNESTAIAADQPPVFEQPSASDYAARAEKSLKEGNVALAIQQYSQAVNADPMDWKLRIKLAEVYATKGMLAEAEDELRRAENAGADKNEIAIARERIKGGPQKSKISTESSNEDRVQSSTESKASKDQPSSDKPINNALPPAILKLIEGDRLWKEGKPDEAAVAYAESIKIDPSDWRAYERLAVVNASMSLFGESRKALEQLAKVQPEPPIKIAENRYDMLRKAFDEHFLALLKYYDATSADFEKQIITRESCYNAIKGLELRLESMAAFLGAMKVPAAKQAAHLRRSVACGLAAQAAASLLDYLETNNKKAKSNASVFLKQARLEMDAAVKLDENRVVVEQTPTVRQSTEEPAANPDE
jgi:tetratricopeptide (TPR) repeat protein